jgi:hypothetical protein
VEFWPTILRVILLPIVGGIIGVAVKTWAENRRFLSLLSVRDVSGWWAGELTNSVSKKEITVLFERKTRWQFGFWLAPRVITGAVWNGTRTPVMKQFYQEGRLWTQTTVDARDEDVEHDLRGGFYLSDHLMLDYRSRDASMRQIGTMMFKLDARGTTLDGHIVGYEDKTFADKITLTRRPEYPTPSRSQPLAVVAILIVIPSFVIGVVLFIKWLNTVDIVPQVGTSYTVSAPRQSMGELLEGYTSHFVVTEGIGIDLWARVQAREELKGRCLKEFSLSPAKRQVDGNPAPATPYWYVMGCGGLPATFRLERRTPDGGQGEP